MRPILIEGASEHNLRGVSLEIPGGALTVFTGVSGSGKSSLAYDTIYREGQRRYLESLSAYARQYLGSMERPRVERIEGLSPTVAIDQKTVGRSPRSTVGTITEVHDHLRLLFARLGTPHCPRCGREIESQTPARIADRILLEHTGRALVLASPVVRHRKGEYQKRLADLLRQGHTRLRIDGKMVRLDRGEAPALKRYQHHTIEIVHDRLEARPEQRARLTESVEKCLELSGGLVNVLVLSRESEPGEDPASSPGKSPRRSAASGARKGDPGGNGAPEERLFSSRFACPDCGESIPEIEPRLFSFNSPHGACPECHGLGTIGETDYGPALACPDCAGTRLRREARAVRFQGRSLPELCALPAGDLLALLAGLRLAGSAAAVGEPILKEIRARLSFLRDVGLEYLSLDRGASTLAGGEAQRLRLAGQVGAKLQGVLFVLDEPSIGLHPRDNRRLLSTLRRLRDNGNTVLVVEHDRETIEAADHLVDIGPGAGREGGEVVAEGTVADLIASPRSITGRYLSGERTVPVPSQRRAPGDRWLEVRGATHNNLKGIDVRIPLGLLVVLTGVSGSGKSSLIDGVLRPALLSRLRRGRGRAPHLRELLGAEHVSGVIEIDQSPIGRTPRSNPATYTGLFGLIRALFAELPEARIRGYGPGRFSFNRDSGRCLQCRGAGVIRIEMQFLAPVEIVCDECGGKRYNRETLEVTYRGRSIADVLALPVKEAAELFRDHPRIHRILEAMERVGLGYVELGQPSTMLSGGEAQRVKIATELHRPETGGTLYLLDEPTTGLHFEDVRTLLEALQGLVMRGSSVLVVEHNPEVMKAADWIIDLGPEGGAGGGEVVAIGPPEEIARSPRSHTGRVLAQELKGSGAALASGRCPGTGPSRDLSPVRARTGRGRGAGEEALVVRGATRHNLKGVNVTIPRNRLTVITGVSGSGKSSLAFDTIFTEGQRRYIESLSTYARRFLGRMESAPVASIEGLGPAIAIDQKSAPRNPRSTVATITEIHDYLRLLYARIGRPHCPTCETPLEWTTPSRLAADMARLHPGERGYILAPIAWPTGSGKGASERREEARAALVKEGFTRLLIGGREVRLDEEGAPGAEKSFREPSPESSAGPSAGSGEALLVVDRVVFEEESRTRLAGSLELAFGRGSGRAAVKVLGSEPVLHSREPSCRACGFRFPEELSPRMFSFNSHLGACPRCLGLGVEGRPVSSLLVPHPERPLLAQALFPAVHSWLTRQSSVQLLALEAMARARKVPLGRPFDSLDPQDRAAILEGTGSESYRLEVPPGDPGRRDRPVTVPERTWPGLIAEVEEWHRSVRGSMKRDFLEGVLRSRACSLCGGGRLRPESLRVRIGSGRGLGIAEVTALTVAGAEELFGGLTLGPREAAIARGILAEVRSRLGFLTRVGLEYLTLDRGAATLSGGEAQRIRLASQIGNRLVGVLYVLDEPTVGLHPRDTARLLDSLRELRDLGNTVILVEHDRDTIEAADWVVDMGPGPGALGGEVVASGPPDRIRRSRRSLTGRYLRGELAVALPRAPRAPAPGPGGRPAVLRLRGVRHHNLRGTDVEFPLGLLTAVSGVSGSGKSSLVVDVLARALRRALAGRPSSSRLESLEGAEAVKRLVVIDQSPIGKSPRSNPATYTGLWDQVRALYAMLPQSRMRGFGPERFSFNLPGGRCAVCEGEGAVRVEMHFLSDVWIPCDECRGERFNRQTLDIRFKGLHVGDLLSMEVDRAREAFADHPRIRGPLDVLHEVGLGYLKLGQSATTLSGGEAQRVKVAADLVSRPGGGAFYILDEPTTGLHFHDVRRLLSVFHRLVDGGNTMVVIEHNLEVIRSADWVIDLGPEGGDAGGRIVAQGPPEEIARAEGSHTGRFLARQAPLGVGGGSPGK